METFIRSRLLLSKGEIGDFLAGELQYDVGSTAEGMLQSVITVSKIAGYDAQIIKLDRFSVESSYIANQMGLIKAGYGSSWDSIEDMIGTPCFSDADCVLIAFHGFHQVTTSAIEGWACLAEVILSEKGWTGDWPQKVRVVLA